MRHKIIFIVIFIIISLWAFLSCDKREGEPNVILTLQAIPDSMYADNGDTGCKIRAILKDVDDAPLVGEKIYFDVDYDINLDDALHLYPDYDYTDDKGVAEVMLWDAIELPIDFVFKAKVTATWSDVSQDVQVRILPVNPDK